MATTYTVLVRNSALGTSRFVGAFEDKTTAERYATDEALRSRKFVSFEVWTGTPRQPGRVAGFIIQGIK